LTGSPAAERGWWSGTPWIGFLKSRVAFTFDDIGFIFIPSVDFAKEKLTADLRNHNQTSVDHDLLLLDPWLAVPGIQQKTADLAIRLERFVDY
jgi:hypothetical protein